jgi:hypothetical protein
MGCVVHHKYAFKGEATFNKVNFCSNQTKKPIPAYGLKIPRKKSVNQKSRDFCQMFVISKKKTIPIENLAYMDFYSLRFPSLLALSHSFFSKVRTLQLILPCSSQMRTGWTNKRQRRLYIGLFYASFVFGENF